MRVSMDLASFELVRNFYDTIMHDVLEAGLLDYGECKQPPRREERRTDLKKSLLQRGGGAGGGGGIRPGRDP